ncbi:unnamed protein product [Urochloa decumbens]|uniref:Uncharacterized protein n=1 Tax=Urochloa decumbens TaxID=240449 RepID=A0ABC8VW92_9POAL
MGEGSNVTIPLLDINESSGVSEELLQREPVPWGVLAQLTAWEAGNLWRISWASILITLFSFSLSLVAQMFVGHLGELELAGTSIPNIGIQGLAYGIMIGMASAVQTVCGQAYGAGVIRYPLSMLYTSSTTVIEAVISLMPLLAFSIFLNGIQPILSGVTIKSGCQAIVAYVNVGAYYLIGLPIGCVLGYKTSLGAAGIWWGLIVGVTVQTIALIVLTARTNWDKEVVKAMQLLQQTGVVPVNDIIA